MNYDIISELPLFRGIDPSELPDIMQCTGTIPKTYERNQEIIPKPEISDAVGIIITGNVKIRMEDIWGNYTVAASLTRGDTFGESFGFGGKERVGISVFTTTKCEILFMPFMSIVHLSADDRHSHKVLFTNMIKIMADRNLDLLEKMEIVTKRTLRDKVLSYLSSQCRQNGSKFFMAPMGRTEMAEYLCADRSALTRELNHLRSDGIIDYDRNTFKILV